MTEIRGKRRVEVFGLLSLRAFLKLAEHQISISCYGCCLTYQRNEFGGSCKYCHVVRLMDVCLYLYCTYNYIPLTR